MPAVKEVNSTRPKSHKNTIPIFKKLPISVGGNRPPLMTYVQLLDAINLNNW